MQMPARTPAMTAMTAMSLAELSGGRFIVGLGASGPQVVEGWHGVPYGKPVTQAERIRADHAADIRSVKHPPLFEGENVSAAVYRAGRHRAWANR